MLRTFQHQGVALSYFDSENGKTPLVFQHGLTGDHQQILASFKSGACRLITLECRGHGKSGQGGEEALSIAGFADDLHALLRHLGVAKAAFAGISMGAAIAANYAARHPEGVSHLFLVRPAWFERSCPENMLAFSAAADFLSLYGPREGLERFARSAAYKVVEAASPDNAASLTGLFAKENAQALPTVIRSILTCDPGFDRAALAALPIPVQVHGSQCDHVHPIDLAKRIAGALPQSEFIELHPKSKDMARHANELTDTILKSIFPELSSTT